MGVQKRVGKISQGNIYAYLKSKLQMQAIITNLSTLIISKEVQNENKRGFGDAGRVTPEDPWLGCSGSSERYSLPGGRWRNTTLQKQLCKQAYMLGASKATSRNLS